MVCLHSLLYLDCVCVHGMIRLRANTFFICHGDSKLFILVNFKRMILCA